MAINNDVYCACKGCTERYVGCHGTCEKYKDFLKRNEEIKQKRKADELTATTNRNGWIYSRRRRDKK